MFGVLVLPLSAMTYYVDCGGSDSNLGTSTSAPWQTLAKVNNSSFSPGDSVLFKAGCTWREQLTVSSSGSAGKPVTFGAYGTGPAPIISGADLLSSWTSDGGLYCSPAATQPNQVFLDGQRLTAVSSESSLVTGTWWWDSSNSRICALGNPSGHTVEASQRNNAIYNFLKSHITISGLETDRTNQDGIYEFGSGITDLLITGVTSQFNYRHGVRLEQATSSNVTQSTVAYNGASGVSSVNTIGLMIDHSTAHHNAQLDVDCCAAGFKFDADNYNDSRNAIVQYSQSYANGSGAHLGSSGQGIWFDTTGDGFVAQYNLIHDNDSGAIGLEAVSNAKVLWHKRFPAGC